MPKIVRVLFELPLDGKKYQPNQLVKLDDKRAKALEAAGAVDSTTEAVEYCKGEGVVVIDHVADTIGADDASAAAKGEGGDSNPAGE